MTTDWEIKRDDPGYNEFSNKIREANLEKQDIRTKQFMMLRKVANLHRAMDVINSKAYDLEGIDEDEDEVLKRHTAEDSDDYFSVFKGAADEMVLAMIQKCNEISGLAGTYAMLQDSINYLNKEQNKYGNELVAKFRAENKDA
jgi:hypothetical protein